MLRIILLAVIAVAATTFGIIQYMEVQERDLRIGALNLELTEAQATADSARKEAKAAQDAIAELRANVARLTTERDAAKLKFRVPATDAGEATATKTPVAEASAEGGGEGMKAFAKMFESEEGKKMMKSQMGMVTRMQYGDLARVLGLSPQDAEQVMALLSDRQQAMADQQFKWMGSGKMDEASMKELETQANAIKADYDTKLKAIMGEEKFAQMKDYDRTLGDRMMMQQFEHQFSSSGSPLQGTQRDQLLQIMSEERKKAPEPIFDNSGQNPGRGANLLNDDAAVDRYLKQEAEYHQRVLAAAPKALNPDQVNALQQAFQQMSEMQKFGIKMSREMFKSGNKAPAAPPANQ